MTELPGDYNLQEKNKALRIIEPVLLGLCLCVISLRATLTEAPNIVSNNLPSGSLDGIYSLTVSTLLFFSALIWLICNLPGRKITYRYSGIEIGLVIFIIAALASIFAASNKRAAISDAAMLTAPMFMAVVLVQILTSEARKKILLFVIIALAIAGFSRCNEQLLSSNKIMIEQYRQNPAAQLSALGIEPGSFQQMLYEHRLESKDIRGFFTTSNSAGAFAGLAGFCGLAFFVQHYRKTRAIGHIRQEFVVYAVIFMIVIAAVIITKSKGAIITAILGAIMFCGYLFGGDWLNKHKRLVVIVCLCMVVTAGTVVVLYGVSNGRLPGGNSMLVRWQYWVGTVKMIAEHGWAGVGGGNFSIFYPHYKDASAIETVRDPHNFLLSILSQYGPFGLLGMLAAIFVPLYRIIFSGKQSSLQSQQLSVKPGASAIYAIVILIVMLVVRPAVMRAELGREPMVVIYVVSVLYVLPAVIFCSLFLLMATQDKNITLGNTAIAALFCAIVVSLIHNCIDFAIFEPGILTVFWAMVACVISMESDRKSRPMLTFRLSIWPGIAVGAIAAILFGAYLWYALIPVGKTSIKICRANMLIAHGDFAGAYVLLDAATADDRFDPASAAMNGRMKLYDFQRQEHWQKDTKLLFGAEKCFLEAISRNRADFKNFEKLAQVYSELGQVSPAENGKWLQKEYDSIVAAVSRYPGSGRLRLKLANTAEMLGKNDIAVENYVRVIEIEDSYRRLYRVMYPGREMFSRVGEEKYRYAKRRLAALQ